MQSESRCLACGAEVVVAADVYTGIISVFDKVRSGSDNAYYLIDFNSGRYRSVHNAWRNQYAGRLYQAHIVSCKPLSSQMAIDLLPSGRPKEGSK